ncbi:MAG TPA: hypothetical protein VNA20_13550 [Frankiaceae bacterium]|nr:hypothetical protein [Frankiaceae bacterium]
MRLSIAATAALVATGALPSVATATPPPVGKQCSFAAVEQQPPAAGHWVGHVRGGPVGVPGASAVTLTCEIHVGNRTHSAAAAVTETSVTAPGATALEPRLVQYTADASDVVAVCTRVVADGTTWYGSGGTWSSDAGSSCLAPLWPPFDPGLYDELPPAAREGTGYALCLVLALSPVQPRTTCDSTPFLTEVFATVDPHACAAFVAARPGVAPVVIDEGGDVYVSGELWWDCPPYQPVAVP